MDALKKSVQAKGRGNLRDSVRNKLGKGREPTDEADPVHAPEADEASPQKLLLSSRAPNRKCDDPVLCSAATIGAKRR